MSWGKKFFLLVRPWLWPGYLLGKIFAPLPWPVAVTNLIFQRLFKLNGEYPFPINFTSRVTGKVMIGKDVWKSFALSGGCYIQGGNGVEIGDYTIFAPGVKIISANHSVTQHDRWETAPSIIIGRKVWLAANVVVLPGVKIGDEAVIGANAVVTKDVPAGAIAAGNPARVLKMKPGFVVHESV